MPAETGNPNDSPGSLGDKLLTGNRDIPGVAEEIDLATRGLSNRINADPERLEKGLAQLVLTVVELLRQLMERQAARRVEGGSLSDEEVERLGEAFMKLEERMDELKRVFELEDHELNLNLGPLGDLL
jgi:hypothetical protein